MCAPMKPGKGGAGGETYDLPKRASIGHRSHWQEILPGLCQEVGHPGQPCEKTPGPRRICQVLRRQETIRIRQQARVQRYGTLLS